jgi:hypothetical protein
MRPARPSLQSQGDRQELVFVEWQLVGEGESTSIIVLIVIRRWQFVRAIC